MVTSCRVGGSDVSEVVILGAGGGVTGEEADILRFGDLDCPSLPKKKGHGFKPASSVCV